MSLEERFPAPLENITQLNRSANSTRSLSPGHFPEDRDRWRERADRNNCQEWVPGIKTPFTVTTEGVMSDGGSDRRGRSLGAIVRAEGAWERHADLRQTGMFGRGGGESTCSGTFPHFRCSGTQGVRKAPGQLDVFGMDCDINIILTPNLRVL